MNINFVELVLTCANWTEAHKIADCLLEKHLVACVNFTEVQSKSWWNGKLEETEEIKLSMESMAENFEAIEAEVARLHSYDTFVLKQFPLTNLSAKAQAWWKAETKGN